MRHIEFVIPKEYDNQKVLAYLKGQAKLSSRLISSLKNVENGITLNGEHIRTVDFLKEGDILAVNLPMDKSDIEPIYHPIDIVYEDNDIIVINKPSGLAMHPTHNHQGDTLANAVAAHFAKSNKLVTFRAVGRLDKCTSGLVVCALNKYSASLLQRNFDKTYYALVGGTYSGTGTIDRPIYRPDPMKTTRCVDDRGEKAVTHWQSLCSKDDITLMRIKLETGRTHQIRVHFASMGTPLCGDEMYGGKTDFISRSALHCGEMTFIHPVTGEKMSFIAPIPSDMQAVLDKIGCNLDEKLEKI